MTKYTCIKTFGVDDKRYMPGDIINVKKMKHAITFSTGNKLKYVDVDSGKLLSEKHLKQNFKKGAYQRDVIKHISKLIFTIAMYELGKWVTEQLIIWWQSDDELDAPLDFTDADHAHLNRLWREVSE